MSIDLAVFDRQGGIVPVGGKLPHSFQVPTGRLLDVVMTLSPKTNGMETREKQQLRRSLNQKLYPKTRPGFYAELSNNLHFAYVGQPDGHGSQHHWKIFCDDGLKP